MRSPGINGEEELRGQLANAGSPGKMAVKTVCVCVCVCDRFLHNTQLYIACKMCRIVQSPNGVFDI